jgi:nucleotide-binding universal stress UspA family protein
MNALRDSSSCVSAPSYSTDPSVPSAAGVKLVGELDQPSKTIPALQLKKLLVPTDFSELPEFVRQLPQDYSESNEETRKQFETAMRRSAERLDTLSRAVKGSNIESESSQRLGTPYEEIVKVAKEMEVDLIVIATHGYTGLKHFLLGSTAERVVRLAPCPVLVVRAEERDFVSQKEGPG